MKKYLLLIIILCVILPSFAQQNIQVTYKAKLTATKNSKERMEILESNIGKEEARKLNDRIKENRAKTNDILADMNFVLKANQLESYYYWEDQVRDETVASFTFEMAKHIGCSGVYYQNKKRNISINQFKSVFKKKWVREYKMLHDTAWAITRETDTILGYQVIKAVKIIRFKKTPNPMIPKVIKKEAWFAPAIPLPFGPKGVGGLPGLVLRYEHVEATEIKFLKKPIKIKEPKKGELLDAEVERKKRIGEINEMLED